MPRRARALTCAHAFPQVFRELMAHVRARAVDTRGVAELRLYVDRDNARAKSTYERLGFSHSHYDFFAIVLNSVDAPQS